MYKPLNLDLLSVAIESGVFRKHVDPQAARDAPLVIDMKMMQQANLVGKITDGIKLLASVRRRHLQMGLCSAHSPLSSLCVLFIGSRSFSTTFFLPLAL